VIGEGLKMSAIGILAGIAAAAALTRAMRSIFVNVSPEDPLTFVAITVLFGLVAFVAASVPAIRASRMDPIEALRDE
jgi:putative ABC transport system permease protein